MKFKILEHRADLKIRVFGRNKKELFKNALIGMFKAGKYEGEKGKVKREIKISSFDSSSLLVDFLAEVLYFCEVNKEVYDIIKFRVFDDNNVEGTLVGKNLKNIGVQIKGVTYHNLEIRQRKDGSWEATILFDI
jgi:SHS2 domain-containing protein